MLTDTNSSICEAIERPPAGLSADSPALQTVWERPSHGSARTAPPSEKTGLSAAPQMRWVDVNYGGVRFLVGSYDARSLDADKGGQGDTFEGRSREMTHVG